MRCWIVPVVVMMCGCEGRPPPDPAAIARENLARALATHTLEAALRALTQPLPEGGAARVEAHALEVALAKVKVLTASGDVEAALRLLDRVPQRLADPRVSAARLGAHLSALDDCVGRAETECALRAMQAARREASPGQDPEERLEAARARADTIGRRRVAEQWRRARALPEGEAEARVRLLRDLGESLRFLELVGHGSGGAALDFRKQRRLLRRAERAWRQDNQAAQR